MNLVLRLARETSWGSTRILGELKKLGYRKVPRTNASQALAKAGQAREVRLSKWLNRVGN